MNTKRLETLDAFRGIAAFSVMLFHYTYGYRIHYNQVYDAKLDFKYGYLGVQFFFIISGFVIFLTILKSKNTFDFLYKRFTRLYPTFLFCLSATFTIISVFGLPSREKSLHTALWNVTMIPNFFGFPSVDGVYWSLVAEIFFYGFMALIMFSKQLKNVLFFGCALLSLCWINRFIYPFPSQWNLALNIDWGALFFAGILFYKLKYEKEKRKWLIILLITLCFITVCLSMGSLAEYIIVAFFFVLFFLFCYDKLEWLKWKPLVFLGKISFPMYLIHQNIGYVILNKIKPFVGNYPILFIVIPVFIVITFSFLIHKLVEKPSINMLRKLQLRYVTMRDHILPLNGVREVSNSSRVLKKSRVFFKFFITDKGKI